MDKIDAKILIVDDDQDVLLAAKLFLKQHIQIVHTEKNPENIPDLIRNENYDLILLDMNFSPDATSGKEGFHWMNKILEIDSLAIVILITGYGDIELAVQGIKEGATNFLLKPWENKKLLATITTTLELRKSKVELEDLRTKQKILIADQNQAYSNFIGQSPAMEKVLTTVQKVAKTDANVLILGENGTGKELIARAVHRASKRKDEVFISVDLGAISETLFESELFGFKKGAFTDAKEDRAGRFEAANKGTIFLDEIGDLALDLQVKLLRVLQDGEFERLGNPNTIKVDVRIIAATNRDLEKAIKNSTFREDLYYRLNVFPIKVPSLRDRKEDIPFLANHFIKKYCKKIGREIEIIPQKVMGGLLIYDWQGNIRELENIIERSLLISHESEFNLGDWNIQQNSQVEYDEKISVRGGFPENKPR